MKVERTDFISVPVTDMERSKKWYGETLGLERVNDGGFPEFQLGENVSLYLLDMEAIGRAFTAPPLKFANGLSALKIKSSPSSLSPKWFNRCAIDPRSRGAGA